MNTEWKDNEELFFREARLGQEYTEHVARCLRDVGLPAVAAGLTLRKHISQADNFKNTKDVICCGKTIETKSRRLRFMGPPDFPYRTVIIDTVNGWRDKEPKPFAYVIVSRITYAKIWISGESNRAWRVVRHFDRIRRIEDDFYEAPLHQFRRFDSLISQLREEKSCG